MAKPDKPVLFGKEDISKIVDRTLVDLRPNSVPRRPPYLMQIMPVGFVESGVRYYWPELKKEYNLKDSSFYDISDWCITQMFDEYGAQFGYRVSGHYAYDEGRIVYEHLEFEKAELFRSLSTTGMSKWKEGHIKVVVLGREAIVARLSPMTDF